jgi:NhaP-type Na+/H+ or K+/H+ antiporter
MLLTFIFILALFLYTLISGRLDRTFVTGPMIFTMAGAILVLLWPPIRSQQADFETFLRISEMALILLLFADASRTNLKVLADIGSLPTRLLSIGMLLTICLGTALAKSIFPELTWWEAGILSSILAPTDAGLGMVIVNSAKVPVSVRQSLNVEAGLNDGLSVPFMLFFVALATAGPGGVETGLLQYMGQQLGFGALVGVGIGYVGGALLNKAEKLEWIQENMKGLGIVALPILCLLACEPIGASAFIASFVAGLSAQASHPEIAPHSVAFTEEWGQGLSFLVFFLFGFLLADLFGTIVATAWLYALLSLTVTRMIPVALSMMGSGMSRSTLLFMGWFGPRGLASIVLGMVFMKQEAQLPGEPTIQSAILATVALSIFLHGATAPVGIGWYSRRIETLSSDAPELME